MISYENTYLSIFNIVFKSKYKLYGSNDKALKIVK